MTLTNLSTMSDSLVLFSSDDEESDSQYESKQYENFTSMLKGVPPPSSITISKFTVEEMLEKYNENQSSFGFGLESNSTNLPSSKNPVPFFKYSNSSQISENIASVAQKVQERYVQMETMSSCNIWFRATLDACGSAKKRLRMRQGAGLSPGRRLSHLARRRQFFSSANLQQLASTENIRQIEIKKNPALGNGRKEMNRTIESEKLKSSKRALFLSPENGTPTKYGNTVAVDRKIYSSGSDERRKLPLQERSKKVEVLRWLSQQNFEIDLPRKRLREECEIHSAERKRKCPRRSLNFTDDDASSNVATSESNHSGDKRIGVSGKLSEIHKNKLLWAVSVVLRENNITRNSEHFRTLAAKLFFTCRTHLDEILNMNTGEGTSDKILHFARSIIPSVFEELGLRSNISPERNVKEEKNDMNYEVKDDLKENINKSNVDNQDPSSKCADNDDKFVFKTPKKLGRKRVVKSCQKAPSSGKKRKKHIMRRWRSLELLIEDAVFSFTTSPKFDMKVIKEKSCVSLEVGNNFCVSYTAESVSNTEILKCDAPNTTLMVSDVTESDSGFCIPTCEAPSLRFVDTTVVFSPVLSSVQEENENMLYSSLLKHETNKEKNEVLNDENSFSQSTDDSMEVVNQDEELRKRIGSLTKDGMFSEEYLIQSNNGETFHNKTVPDANDPSPPTEITDNNNEETEPCLASATGSETKTEKSLNFIELSHDTKYKTEEDFNAGEEVKQDFKFDTNGNNEEWEPSTPEYVSKVEKGTYKPRKLVVKKSKPNWKVVRKNSEEAQNESELKLKMRLSHEWEVVCRNSSCSDIGNNSECETISMNCSQMSRATDKEIISDNEVEGLLRRNSTPSRWDESMDEGITDSNIMSPENMNIPGGGADRGPRSNICRTKAGLNKCGQIEQKPLNQILCTELTRCKGVLDHEEEKISSQEEDYNITDADDRLCEKEGMDDSDVEQIAWEEGSKSLCANVRHSTNINEEETSEKKKRIHSACLDEKTITRGNSPIFFSSRLSEENSSKKGKFCSSPEAGAKEDDYLSSKRIGETEKPQYDSESGTSNGPERKKRLLSLENYKARRLEEASKNIKLETCEQSEPKDVSSDEKGSDSTKTKKIYNITLKHPIRYHKSKRKHKHKHYDKKRKQKHEHRERDREKSNRMESEGGDTSDLHVDTIRQFPSSFHGKDTIGKIELRDGVRANIQNEHNGKNVNIQTIIDALSALSNLVQEHIKIENGIMNSQNESGGNGPRRSNFLDIVSSWCGRNLNNFKLISNASSLSQESLDDGSVAAMKQVLNFSMSESSVLANKMSNIEHSSRSDNGISNNPGSICSSKTEYKPAQDCTGLATQQINFNEATNAVLSNVSLLGTTMNLSQGSTELPYNQTVRFQNNPIYSNNTGSQSGEMPLNWSVPFSFSTEAVKASTDKRTVLRDPRCNPDSRLRNRSGYDEYGLLMSNQSKEYPSLQTQYQYSNPCVSAQKPSFYQPNMYSNYQNWQMESTWNYQGEDYQNPAFYPFQMSNVPYYINKY